MLAKWMVLIVSYVLLLEIIEMVRLKDHYHQTDFNVKLEIIEIVNVNSSYGRNFTAGLHWHNRTTRVINGHGTLIKEINNKFKFDVQAFKFLSNEYRFFPITVSIECSHIVKNTFGIMELFAKYSNIPTNCSVPKGYYYMANGVYDMSQLPPYIPTGRYKLEIKLYNDQDYTGTLNIYCAIEEIKNWWKN